MATYGELMYFNNSYGCRNDHEVFDVSESEEEEEDYDYDEEEDEDDYYPDSFIEWFCAQEEHRYFCELDKSFVVDAFNLYGIKPLLEPHYDDALRTIIDHEGKVVLY